MSSRTRFLRFLLAYTVVWLLGEAIKTAFPGVYRQVVDALAIPIFALAVILSFVAWSYVLRGQPPERP